jgi:uncharacterized protein YwbE
MVRRKLAGRSRGKMMNPQDEQLDERLSQLNKANTPGQSQYHPWRDDSSGNAEVDELTNLARHLQAAPQVRVDADFAQTLERRLLRQALTNQQAGARKSRLRQAWQRHRVAISFIGLGVLLLLLLGIGLLVLALQTAKPTNPLYSFEHGQTPGQTTSTPFPTLTSTATLPPDQASLDLQVARSHLQTLLTLTAPAQSSAYVQTLSQFDTQLTKAANAISALPAGTEKSDLSTQLSTLRSDARQQLRALLHTLTSTASAATTTELGRLGEAIPSVTGASIILPAHPKGNATISITGSGIQPGAQLLVDGKLVQATGTLKNGQIVFVLTWKSEKHPHSLGIVNPDGTVAQTTNVTITSAQKDNGNGNGSNK